MICCVHASLHDHGAQIDARVVCQHQAHASEGRLMQGYRAGLPHTHIRLQAGYRQKAFCCRAAAAEGEGVCMTDLAVLEAAREALGFQLTGGQEQALDNVLRDLEGPAPMMCLLQVRLPI